MDKILRRSGAEMNWNVPSETEKFIYLSRFLSLMNHFRGITKAFAVVVLFVVGEIAMRGANPSISKNRCVTVNANDIESGAKDIESGAWMRKISKREVRG